MNWAAPPAPFKHFNLFSFHSINFMFSFRRSQPAARQAGPRQLIYWICSFIPIQSQIHKSNDSSIPFGLFVCVRFLWRSPLALLAPITAAGSQLSKPNQTPLNECGRAGPSIKKINQWNQNSIWFIDFFSLIDGHSARTAIHFINHSWIGLFSWAGPPAAAHSINFTIQFHFIVQLISFTAVHRLPSSST